MPTVSTDVDSLLASADKAAMGVALGATALSGTTAFSSGLHVHKGNVQGVVIGQMGINALQDASDSVRIGFGAGESGAAASTSAVFLGRHAGSHAVGNHSVFVGHAPGQYAYNSANSVMIGYLAGRNPAMNGSYTGFSAVIIGHEAGTNGVANQASVLIGAQAGKSCTTASGSVMIGYEAGRSATSANGAVIIGYGAGTNAATATSGVIIGLQAGLNATSAARCVLIGNEAGYGLTAATDRLIIESNTTYRNTGLIAGNFATAERSVVLNCLKLGMYSATPVTKQSITGSRAAGAALADLLTKLALIGIITDSTSA